MNKIFNIDAYSGVQQLADKSIHCIVTSPPYYGLRSYGTTPFAWPAVTYTLFGFQVEIPEMICELGQEENPKAFIGHIVLIMREARRVLRDDGTCWINMGDTFAGSWGAMSHQALGKFRGMADARPPQSFTKSKRGRKEDGVSRWGGGNVVPSDGLKPGDLIMIPAMMAMALRDDGWNLRQEIIWSKPNSMPESVETRCTRSHEFVYMLSKPGPKRCWRARDTNEWVFDKPDLDEKLQDDICPQWKNRRKWMGYKYYYNADAIKTAAKESSVARVSQDVETQEGSPAYGKTNGNMKPTFHGHYPRPGIDTKGGNQAEPRQDKQRGHSRRHNGFNGRWDKMSRMEQQSMRAAKRSVWTVSPAQYPDDHFAVFPEELIWDMVLAGCPPGGVVLDPFFGRGTTGVVARKQDKNYIGIELLEKNVKLAEKYMQEELVGWQREMFLEPIKK